MTTTTSTTTNNNNNNNNNNKNTMDKISMRRCLIVYALVMMFRDKKSIDTQVELILFLFRHDPSLKQEFFELVRHQEAMLST